MPLPELETPHFDPIDPFGLAGAESDKNARLGRYFDESYYLKANPDIAAVKNGNSSFDAKQHFIDYGMKEGRSPSLYFDEAHVRHHLARIARETPPKDELLAYFLALPPARRFVPNRWFSAGAFRTLYTPEMPELEGLSDYELFEVYLDRHRLDALSPCGAFDEARYRRAYPQVAAAIGRGELSSAFMHFVFLGGHAGHANLPGALAPENHDAEADWLRGGQVGLAPLVWWFDEAFYLGAYPDVHELVRRFKLKSGLEHYLIAGCREGRVPSVAAFAHLPAPDADPWGHFIRIRQDRRTTAQRRPIAEICAVQRHLRGSAHAAPPREIADALWPHVEPPVLGGTFDPALYLAVNIDVARSLGDGPSAAETHWREFGRKEHRIAPGTNVFSDRAIGFEDVLSWKSGVNLFGPMSARSGLGTAARGYLAALRAAGIPADAYDVSNLINPDLPVDLFCSEELRYSINLLCVNADLVPAFVHRFGTEMFSGRANVGAWVWELPAPRPEWRTMLSAFDLIICPSDFCSAAFALSTDRPVRTVPYVVDHTALQESLAERAAASWTAQLEAEKAAGIRIVLFVMDASSYRARKGVDLFIALAERVNHAHPGKFRFVIKTHSRDISMTHLARHGDAVLTIDAVFSFAELCQLKALADLYVSPHRSEGFGLNIIESILLGVPVLCSDHAGAVGLLHDNIPALVPVELAEIGQDMGPYRAEAVWAAPDLELFEAALLAYFAAPKPKALLAAQRERLRAALSAESVGAQLGEVLTAHCALGAEHRADKLQAFQPLAGLRPDECYKLGYVTEAARRSPDAPGLDRLSEIAVAAGSPYFTIISVVQDIHASALEALYEALLQQSYPSWEWCIADIGEGAPQTEAALRAMRRRDARIKLRLAPGRAFAAACNDLAAASQGRYLIMLGAEDHLAGGALAAYVEHLRRHDAGGIVYCDEPRDGDSPAWFKPDLSPELLLGAPYIGRAFAMRKAAYLALGGLRADFPGAELDDLLLRALDEGVPFEHLAAPLHAAPRDDEGAAFAGAVAAHLAASDCPAEMEPGLLPGTWRPRPRLSSGRASLNILTACTPHHDLREDDGGRPEPWMCSYAAHFVTSILRFPPDLDFEIRIIADRHALPLAEPLATLDPRVRVVPFERKGAFFNFAEKANFAIESAPDERIILLNDDMEALDADWLPALLEMLELPGIGIAGGELLYEDDTLQHGGVVFGIHGATAHLFEGTRRDYIAPHGHNKLIRNASAVTGAMFAMRRASFARVGGFDERFPVDYNDIDFCLRAAEAGLRTVYTPFARLRHFESRSATRLAVDELDRARFNARWASYLARDPHYNPNLSRSNVLWEPA